MNFRLKQNLAKIGTALVVGFLLLHFFGYGGWIIIQIIFWIFAVCFVIVRLLPYVARFMMLLLGSPPPKGTPPDLPPPARQTPAFCPKCGASWTPGARFCANCGQ